MNVKSAQLTLLVLALFAVLCVILVFLTGRIWGFPLDYQQQEEIPLIELVAPPFFGVLGSAANYLRSPDDVEIEEKHRMLIAVLILAPTSLFLLLFAVLTIVFHLANQPGSSSYFSLDAYRLWLTLLLSFITLSVPAISGTIFRVRAK